MEEKVFDQNYLKVYLDKNAHYVKLEWDGFVRNEDFRSGLEFGLKMVVDNDLTGWIADLRKMRVIKVEDQEWTNNYWMPKLAETNLKRMSVVNSTDIFNKVGAKDILTRASGVVPFDIQYFDDVALATDWVVGN